MLTTDDARATVLRLYEALNSGDDQEIGRVVDTIAHPDLEIATPLPGDGSAVERIKHGHAALRLAFPDLGLDVQEVIVEGDKAVAHVRTHGTHSGSSSYLGLEPTGKSFVIDEIMIFRFAPDGRVIGIGGIVDTFAQVQQLGAVLAVLES